VKLDKTNGPSDRSDFEGNILLFYAFDVGDEIDLKAVQQKGLISTHEAPLSSYFKNYHVPLSFHLSQAKDGTVEPPADSLLNKIHHFGVLSFCYRIPFHASLEHLKSEVLEVTKKYDRKSEVDARSTFDRIKMVVGSPHFYNLKNSYFAIHVNPRSDKMESLEFKEQYGDKK